jgi:hypothetical protein
MARSAQPFNFKRLIVIGVMSLNICGSAFAGFFNQLSTLNVNVGVRPTIHFLPGQYGQGVSFSPLSEITGVAGKTGSSGFPIRISTGTGRTSHSPILVYVEHDGKCRRLSKGEKL